MSPLGVPAGRDPASLCAVASRVANPVGFGCCCRYRPTGGKRMRRLIWAAVVAGVVLLGLSVAAFASKPPAPPGGDPCSHGRTGKPCRSDPQPGHGKDCEHHGRNGGVNEDHCGGGGSTSTITTTTTSSTTRSTSTQTSTTTGSSTTVAGTTAASSTTTVTSSGGSTAPASTTSAATTSGSTTSMPSSTSTPSGSGISQTTATAPVVSKRTLRAALKRQERLRGSGRASGLTRAGELPNTGFDEGVLAALGLGLLLGGVGLRRLGRAC